MVNGCGRGKRSVDALVKPESSNRNQRITDG